MFFNYDEEALRRIRETVKQVDPAKAAGPIFIIGADGAVTIDDPSLVTVVSVEDGWPSDEELDKLSFLHPMAGWLPIREHPHFAQPTQASTQNQEKE